jgi:transposase-like protein
MNASFASQFRATLEAQETAVQCPQCHSQTPRTIGWMLANTRLTCPSCGAVIELDTKKLHAVFGNMEKTAQQLEENLTKATRLLDDGRSGS